ncbi:hypothetical protein DYB32_008901 [Aphanomyces invadans]|uniref:Uncharacterized protein n=1 Tax=Aphanomyces invadans TaxID=157072 RepID=A0A418AJU1_9STRA|nr:hypothetical protein DYB32_008901 [Aphanomyces invadans]
MQGVAARGGSKTQTKVLTKQAGERLGLSLISLNPGASGNIYVSSIAPNSTAYRKKVGVGRCSLLPLATDRFPTVVILGWELLYVNGKNVENMTVDDIARLAGGSCKEKSRQAMLVDKLTYMGFSKADAVLSCEKCGIDNIDANMLWLVSMVEERRFQNELNKAQIESELQKRSEDSQHKQKEQEVLQTASSLRELFPDSVVFDPVTQAPLVIHLIETFLVKLNDTAIPLRQAVVDILTQEAKARRWYPRPAQCYIANLVQRVNSTISSHPPTAACCARRDANECPLVTIVQTELATLKSHLYMSTSNVGGVPLAFLEADDENRFSLADDGFEVCNVEDLVSDDDE